MPLDNVPVATPIARDPVLEEDSEDEGGTYGLHAESISPTASRTALAGECPHCHARCMSGETRVCLSCGFDAKSGEVILDEVRSVRVADMNARLVWGLGIGVLVLIVSIVLAITHDFQPETLLKGVLASFGVGVFVALGTSHEVRVTLIPGRVAGTTAIRCVVIRRRLFLPIPRSAVVLSDSRLVNELTLTRPQGQSALTTIFLVILLFVAGWIYLPGRRRDSATPEWLSLYLVPARGARRMLLYRAKPTTASRRQIERIVRLFQDIMPIPIDDGRSY